MFSLNQAHQLLSTEAAHSRSNARSCQLRVLPKQPARPERRDVKNRRLRIVLYSHDTMGLGHKRRNLLIAQALGTSSLNADILIISGTADASTIPLPEGVDYLTLPALYKCADGQYRSRRLGLALEEMIDLRSQIICTAVKSFQPDVLIVDNVPRGAKSELNPTLEYVASQPHIHCILGLRDVLDNPAAVQRDWQRADNIAAIRHYYETIWVYGDSDIYDIRTEYGLPADVTAKIHPLGYLDQRARLRHTETTTRSSLEALQLPKENMVLCLVGGGQDGVALATAFAQATFPPGMTGVLLTGPFMPLEIRERLYHWAATNPQLRILDYFEEPTLLIEQASRVISMGGYNTTCEILSFQKQALIVPRITPRQEQWIRAERLQRMGYVDMLHPDALSPDLLSAWLRRPIDPQQVPPPLNLGGLDNLLVELKQMVTAPRLRDGVPPLIPLSFATYCSLI